jgi:hypothetical protein
LINTQILRTANFLITHASLPWSWGKWDCNTFIALYLDHLDGGCRSLAICDQYKDLKTALRFQREFTPAPDWLVLQGMKIINTKDVCDLDIILEPHQGYWHAGLVFGGDIWSVEQDRGTVIRPIEAQEYMLGRRHG